MSLFNILPDKFFSLLASPNKSIYFDCLVITFDAYEEASILGVDRKLIIELITDYLDKVDVKLIDEEEGDESSDNTSRAYQILKKFETHGWIDLEVTNDYEELISFREYAITVIEALKNIRVNEEGVLIEIDDDDIENFKGYIYTIYSVLLNKENEHGYVIDTVYKNTKMFMRELRKLDVRMKEYIKAIVDTFEIKDLMEMLLKYKVELFDKTYKKLKTSNNVNKYRLYIVNALTDLVNDTSTIELIANSHRYNSIEGNEANLKAISDIYEIIDTFNNLDEFISEIDKKNKTYINSTIAKIQFLLNEEADISGKLNSILKFITDKNKKGQMNDAMKVINPLYNLNQLKSLNQNSLYVQRGVYKKFEPARLDVTQKTVIDFEKAFFDEYKSIYTESLVYQFTMENMVDNVFRASDVLDYEASLGEILMILFCLIYADQSRNLKVRRLEADINHVKYILKDFEIYVEGK